MKTWKDSEYTQNPAFKERRRAYMREKRANPAYREAEKAAQKKYRDETKPSMSTRLDAIEARLDAIEARYCNKLQRYILDRGSAP